MEATHVLAILAVVAAWGVLFHTIRRWGPGQARRWVRCPEKKKLATLTVEQREGDFGRLRVVDVKPCSLLPHQPVTCDKDCLARF